MMLGEKLNLLSLALQQAEIRQGECAPNPSVGAIIVNDRGEILSKGYHLGPGFPHAEVDALQKLKQSPENCVLYVTLEPCCHQGRTPACTKAIIKSGIKRVIYGCQDPNPIVAGKGEKELIQAGIQCECILHQGIGEFYRSYLYWHKTNTPFVTAKLAMSLNGMIAGKGNQRIQISDEALHDVTHQKRKQADAVLTTAKTIFFDNPQLNARMPHQIIPKPIYLLDSNVIIPSDSIIFSSAKSITLFHSNRFESDNVKTFSSMGIDCIGIDEEKGKLSLTQMIAAIGKRGTHDLLVEAGGTLFASLLKQNLLQHAYLYVAPNWIHEGTPAFKENLNLSNDASQLSWSQKGKDAVCEIFF